MNTEELFAAIAELEKFADLEGSEWGETAHALINMWYGRTLLSKRLVSALEKEILTWLKDVKKNATIVEREETFTRKIKDLEWY